MAGAGTGPGAGAVTARAFAAAIIDVAQRPRDLGRDARAAGDAPGARPAGSAGAGRYRVLATGERLSDKPEDLTHLVDDESLVPKTHPRIALRGKLDLLQSQLLDAQVAGRVQDGGSHAPSPLLMCTLTLVAVSRAAP